MAEKKVTKTRSAKVSFENEFYSDLSAAGMLYAKIIRSPIKRGIIKSVSHPSLADGYYIFTARNIPGNNLMDTPLGKVPILSEGNVSYLGEPIGILAGPDEKQLEQYFSEIQIDFDRNSIDYYFSANESHGKKKAEETKQDIEELFSPVIASRSILYGNESKDFDSLFTKADPERIIETTYSYALSQLHCSETSGSLCTFEDGILTVFSPTQWFYSLRKILSESLALNPEDIVIKKTKSFSNGTNGIYFNSVITAQTALVSILTGKSCKLVYTRNEQETFMDSMQPIKISHKSIVEKDAKIKAMDITINMDAGFINPFCQEIIDRLVIAAAGCYAPENLRVTASAERSYNPPSSIDLRQIDSAAFFAVENHLSEISSKLDIFPTDLRIKNFNIPPKKKKTSDTAAENTGAFPFTFNIEKFEEAINALTKKSDFNRKYFFYNTEKKLRSNLLDENTKITTSAPLKGIGFACAYEGSCYYGSQIYSHEQSLELTLDKDETLTIHCPTVSSSIELIWKNIITSMLDIPQGNIKFNSSFLNDDEPLSPDSVYSNISIMTDLLKKCCKYLNTKRGSAKFPLTVRKSMSPNEKKVWNRETFSGQPFYSTSFAACSVETEIDRSIFREKIKEINLVISGGKILSVPAAEGSIKLSILRVLRSFMEDDELDAGKVHISFLQSEENPRQIGELVFNVLSSALVQSINQAINCEITEIPMKTDSMFNILMEKKLKEHKEEQYEDSDDAERQKDDD